MNFFWIFAFVTGIKIILMKSYFSTDFEVHRNWLAITHNLPLSQWYYDETSQWTLDYPPFFAYFEWFLSQFAKYIDPLMLNIKNLNYDSIETVLFQRTTVIITDIIYAFGVKLCLKNLNFKSTPHNYNEYLIGSGLLLCNIGLLFIDHIHFQYNGFLFGILLLSIGYLLQNNYLISAILFMILLNLKHIFLYIAPVYAIYFLRFYCIEQKKFLYNFFKLILLTCFCLILSFGPFINHLPQILSRLFPFKRGLTHVYWAPNFWSLYNFIEKIFTLLFNGGNHNAAINTNGLISDFKHQILPTISPIITFILTGLFMLPCLYKLFFKTTNNNSHIDFLKSIVICSCTSFMFGWHVHEKAILMVIIPISLLAMTSRKEAEFAFFLWWIGHYSLHPLLFNNNLIIIKYSLILAYQFGSYDALCYLYPEFQLKFYEIIYFMGFILLCLYHEILQYFVWNLNEKLPFLPLLMTSVYCSLGILYFYVKYYYQFLIGDDLIVKSKENIQTNSKKRKLK